MNKHEPNHTTTEGYIVRIYRHQSGRSQGLAGTIKDVVDGNEQAFHTSQDM